MKACRSAVIVMIGVVVSFTGCGSFPSEKSRLHPVIQDMEVGKIYEVHTKKGEKRIIEVKAFTSTDVVGLRQTVAIDDIDSVEQELADPPKSAVKVVATTIYVGALVVAVLLLLVLI